MSRPLPWRVRVVLVAALLGGFLAWRAAAPERAHAGHGAGKSSSAATPAAAVARGGGGQPSAPGTARRDPAAIEEAATRAAIERHLRKLRHDPDPRRRLIAHGILGGFSPSPADRRQAQRAIAQLRREAPDDPLIAMAQGWFCGGMHDPCEADAHDAWSGIEPDNAAAYLDQLAHARRDPARTDALLAQMANGTRHDTHARALSLEAMAAFDDYTPPPTIGPMEQRLLGQLGFAPTLENRRQLVMAQYAWAMPGPPHHGITSACTGPIAASRARQCRTVLMRMASSSTTPIERGIALGTLERLMRGSVEHPRWLLALRRHRWLMQQFSSLITDPGYWRDFVRAGELEAMRLALLRSGKPLDPPPGFGFPRR